MAYPHKTYEGTIGVRQAIDNDATNYLHLFCPFWVSGDAPYAKLNIKNKMVSELKLNFGNCQNIFSVSGKCGYGKVEKMHILKSIFYKIFAENNENMIIFETGDFTERRYFTRLLNIGYIGK